MLACTIHCRHLMVWKIFAPRFIYEGIATFIYLPLLMVGYLGLARVHGAVVRLIAGLTRTMEEDIQQTQQKKTPRQAAPPPSKDEKKKQ